MSPLIEDNNPFLGTVGALPEEESFDPTVGETFGAAFRTENTVHSFLQRAEERQEVPESPEGEPVDYDPFQDIEGTVFEDRPEALLFVETPEQRAAVERNILRELEDRRTVAASGATGFAASFAAGLFDPLILIPVGGQAAVAAKGSASLLRGAAAVGRAGFIGSSLAELALQSTQTERTFGESATNIAAATFLSGVIGASLIGVPLARQARLERAVTRDMDLAKPSGVDFKRLAISGASASVDSLGSSGSAAGKIATLDLDTKIGEELARSFKLTETLTAGGSKAGLTPGLRVAAKSRSMEARKTLQELVDTPWFYQKNADGVATPISVESKVQQWDANLALGLEEMDRQFVAYRSRIAGKSPGRFRGLDRAKFFARDKFNPSIDRLSFKEFREAIGEALRHGDRDVAIPEVGTAARAFREQIFDPLKDRAIHLNLLPEDVAVETAASYLMRVYNPEALKGRSDVFIRRTDNWLQEVHPELSSADRGEVARRILNKLLQQDDGRIGYEPLDLGAASPLKKRTFNIRDSELSDHFLENDIEVVARHYIRTMAPDVELREQFGSVDLKKELIAIRDEYNDFIDSNSDLLSNKQRTFLEERKQSDLKDMEAMAQRIRHIYGAPTDSSSLPVRVGRGLRRGIFVTKGGGFAVSSLPDLANIVMANGLKRTIGTTFKAMAANMDSIKMSAKEAKLAGTALDMTLNTRAERLAEIGGEFGRHSAIERFGQGLSDSMGLVNLLAPWNAAVKQFSGIVTQHRILDVAEALVNGKVSAADLRRLRQAGISDDIARRIASEFAEHGETDSGIRMALTENWKDFEARDVFRAALRKEIDTQVVTPGAADLPLWMSSEGGKMLGQFKSFTISATQRTLLMRVQQGDAAVMNGALLSMGLGFMVYALKRKQAGLEVSDDPAVIAKEAIDRSGVTGVFSDINNILERVSANRLGLSAVIGGPTASRYATRNLAGVVAGPSIGFISQALAVPSAVLREDTTAADITAIRRMLPYQNLFYMDKLFDSLEEAGQELAGASGN